MKATGKLMQIIASRIRALPIASGAIARPLPIRPEKVTVAPRPFGRMISRRVASLPVTGSVVPGIRGGLLRQNGKFVLIMRKILADKMNQGIPFYMARKMAEDEASRIVRQGG